jgi:hypothetical protein
MQVLLRKVQVLLAGVGQDGMRRATQGVPRPTAAGGNIEGVPELLGA